MWRARSATLDPPRTFGLPPDWQVLIGAHGLSAKAAHARQAGPLLMGRRPSGFLHRVRAARAHDRAKVGEFINRAKAEPM
jgi:hypothetical protein